MLKTRQAAAEYDTVKYMTTAAATFSLTEVKELIDSRLLEYCKVRTLSAQQVGERYVLLWSTIRSLFEAGGKRLRPYILLSTFDAFAPNDEIESIMPAALAQEMIHVAMLIHDDIIDRDTVRYGIKNISGQYNDNYEPYVESISERMHITQSSALLAGDVLISDAYRLLSKVDRPHEVVTQAISIFSNGIFDVVGGELIDTESAFIPSLNLSAETIARFKTASYSFISPLTMGATLANASTEQVALLHRFGEMIGIGYQLKDDLLGVFGDEDETGKSTSSDIREGKNTVLIEQFRVCGTASQKKKFFELFKNPDATDSEIAEARTILLESGAKVRVDERIAELKEASEAIIEQLEISKAAKQSFTELLTLCFTRNA